MKRTYETVDNISPQNYRSHILQWKIIRNFTSSKHNITITIYLLQLGDKSFCEN